MISYAQNFEDVLLNRVLREVAEGFYVDIGAYDPEEGSVTKHFYEMGWRGINIEPGPGFEGLKAERPRDVNLNVAVSDRAGSRIFFEHPEDLGSSTLAKSLHPNLRGRVATRVKRSVKAMSLAGLLQQYAPHATIDFMKIDVEGHERKVMLGGDWKRFRPRVLLAEATEPYSNESRHEDWEDILLRADYHFAYFDGLNRYYVRKEDAHLLERFRAPVNVLDDFELAGCVAQRLENTRLRTEIERAEAGVELVEESLGGLVAQVEAFRKQLETAKALAKSAEEARDQAVAKIGEVQAKYRQAQAAAAQAKEENKRLSDEAARLQTAITSLTRRTGPRSLGAGLWIARALHRSGRWIGLARPAASEEDVAPHRIDRRIVSQLGEIDSRLREIQGQLQRFPQGAEQGSHTEKTDRLVIALLKMAQAGRLGGRFHGQTLGLASDDPMPGSIEARSEVEKRDGRASRRPEPGS